MSEQHAPSPVTQSEVMDCVATIGAGAKPPGRSMARSQRGKSRNAGLTRRLPAMLD